MGSIEELVGSKDARDLGSFITSFFDDYGLDPIEFRIYARLCRRANSGKSNFWESVPNMAKALKISERKIRYAMRLFEESGMVRSTRRPGKSTLYILLGEHQWAPSEKLSAMRENIVMGDPKKRPAHKPKQTPAFDAGDLCTPCSPTPASDAGKGTSLEGTSKKEPAAGGLTFCGSFFEEEFGIELPAAARKANPERLKGMCRKNKLGYEEVRVVLAELQAWHEDGKITGTVETAFGQLAGWAKVGSLYLSARGEEILMEGSR